MSWEKVGNWIKDNAGSGAALVGSLLTGNVPGAVAAGVALVSDATGSDTPTDALLSLQGQPEALLRLKELAHQERDQIRKHIEAMKRLELEDQQAAHATTQATVIAGDKAEDWFVRRTRPAQAWLSLVAAIAYVFWKDAPDVMVLGALLTMPWAYAGLREVGKGIQAFKKKAPEGAKQG